MSAWRRLAAQLERQAALLAATSALLICLLWRLPAELDDDGWLTLLFGRAVWRHGLPHHDTLTYWSAGRAWSDQQWLGQLAFYGLERLGGIPLVMLALVVITALSLLLAALLGQRLGGSPRAAAPLAFLAMTSLFVMTSLRVQALALPLFGLVLFLLAADARRERPGRRLLWLLPLLVVWGNLHGSALVGCGLCVLYGLDRLRRSQGRAAAGWALLLSPALLLATPYGFGVVGYYRQILVNPDFARLVAEWEPARPGPLTASFYLLALVVLAIVWRQRPPLADTIVLLALVLLGVAAVRDVVWLSLAAPLLLAAPLQRELARQGSDAMPRPLRLLLVAGTLSALVYLGWWAAQPANSYQRHYPPPVAAAAARGAGRDRQVIADLRYADWLLYTHPALAGRVAFDSRLELLTHRRFQDLDDWYHAQDGFLRLAQGRVVVVDRTVTPDTFAALLARHPRVLYAHGGLDVLLLP